MRILFYSLNYAPELVGIGKYNSEFASWLTEQGHEVKVICTPPYYPAWSIQEGYSGWRYCKELVDNISIYRCPTWVPNHPSGLKRILHLLSFTVSSFPMLVLHTFHWRPDIIFILEPPFFCLPSALLIGKLAKSKVCLHVQDFELDAGFSFDLVPNFLILKKLLFTIESSLMRKADLVSTISNKMFNLLIKKNVQKEKCLLFPNWVDTRAIFPARNSTVPNLFREKLGILPQQIVCLYSGNIGKKQNIGHIIEVAQRLKKDANITFVIAGEGSEKATIAEKARGLSNVHLLTLQPVKQLNELLNLADIHLLPQSAEAADLVMPSKLQAMFASGRPVITTSDPNTQLSQVVEGRGIVVPPNNIDLLSKAIQTLSQDTEIRLKLGTSARNYAIKHWDREHVMADIEEHFIQLAKGQLIIA